MTKTGQRAKRKAFTRPRETRPLVVEFHYADGDVGAHPEEGAVARTLWAEFTPGHEPSHVVIRPAEPDEVS
jgi:hypothetical protein